MDERALQVAYLRRKPTAKTNAKILASLAKARGCDTETIERILRKRGVFQDTTRYQSPSERRYRATLGRPTSILPSRRPKPFGGTPIANLGNMIATGIGALFLILCIAGIIAFITGQVSW